MFNKPIWLLLGTIADSAVFIVLFIMGALKLDSSVYEACALICTAVFYQRAWRWDILFKMVASELKKPQQPSEADDE